MQYELSKDSLHLVAVLLLPSPRRRMLRITETLWTTATLPAFDRLRWSLVPFLLALHTPSEVAYLAIKNIFLDIVLNNYSLPIYQARRISSLKRTLASNGGNKLASLPYVLLPL